MQGMVRVEQGANLEWFRHHRLKLKIYVLWAEQWMHSRGVDCGLGRDTTDTRLEYLINYKKLEKMCLVRCAINAILHAHAHIRYIPSFQAWSWIRYSYLRFVLWSDIMLVSFKRWFKVYKMWNISSNLTCHKTEIFKWNFRFCCGGAFQQFKCENFISLSLL